MKKHTNTAPSDQSVNVNALASEIEMTTPSGITLKTLAPNLIYFFEVYRGKRFRMVFDLFDYLDDHRMRIKRDFRSADYVSAYPIKQHLIGLTDTNGDLAAQPKLLAMFAHKRHFWSKNRLYPLTENPCFTAEQTREITAEESQEFVDPEIQALLDDNNALLTQLKGLYLSAVQAKKKAENLANELVSTPSPAAQAFTVASDSSQASWFPWRRKKVTKRKRLDLPSRSQKKIDRQVKEYFAQ